MAKIECGAGRQVANKVLVLPLLLLFGLPAIATLIFMVEDALSPAAWMAVFLHPQLSGGLALSVLTAIVSSCIAILLSFLIAASGIKTRWLSALLAAPHLAFAIGLGFLVMPSGLLARLAALVTGWQSPPHWITTHDPYGLLLIVALACKETPFLLFVLLSVLAREDVRRSFAAQTAAATALGHGSLSIWLRLLVPQLLPLVRWPMAIVFTYAATVVDMALVLGPTQPPTFALVVWSDITSANPANNARGGAGAMLLSLAVAAVLVVVSALAQWFHAAFLRWAVAGPSLRTVPVWLARAKWLGLRVFYLTVTATLIILSIAVLWPFPNLVPDFSLEAWRDVALHSAPLANSLLLATLSAATGLVLLVAWFESVGARADRPLLIIAMLLLGLPVLLTGLGQYRLFLHLGLTATAPGMFLAHLLPATAYMCILLAGPYRGFDPRWREVSDGLMRSRMAFLWAVKWPLLKAPLSTAAAVGFAVAFAQYVPAQLVSAGRYSTLTIEAVTLSSGGNRPLTAAFALLLMLPPLIAFGLSTWAGRAKWV